MKASTIYQRKRRERLTKLGYKRVELELHPDLFNALLPHIEPYQGSHYPGYALTRFLENKFIKKSKRYKQIK